MREKIAKTLFYAGLKEDSANTLGYVADEILTLIREEIEKVENPYYLKDFDGGYYNKYPDFAIFEEARQAILKALEV